MTHETPPILAKDYICDKLKKNAQKAGNRLDELIDTYATLYGKKEPVGIDIYISKTNGGWKRRTGDQHPRANRHRIANKQGHNPGDLKVNVGHMSLL